MQPIQMLSSLWLFLVILAFLVSYILPRKLGAPLCINLHKFGMDRPDRREFTAYSRMNMQRQRIKSDVL